MLYMLALLMLLAVVEEEASELLLLLLLPPLLSPSSTTEVSFSGTSKCFSLCGGGGERNCSTFMALLIA